MYGVLNNTKLSRKFDEIKNLLINKTDKYLLQIK